MSKQSFIEKCYKDDQGKVSFAQPPNLPIIVWVVSVVLQKLISNGTIYNLVSVIGFGALFTWAWLEIFQGSNYFRRILGLVVLIMAIASQLSSGTA